MTTSSSVAYQTVLKENDYYRSIIENNSFYIIKTDLEGKYTYLNPFFCKMLSLKAGEWIGKDSLSLIVPEDHQACIDTVTACFTDPSVSHWVILRKPVPTGSISTQWEFKLISDAKGTISEILCIGHDITPLIMRQDELESLVGIISEQNKRLVNFTYIISHNIRSHVANIIGIVDVNTMDDEMDDKTALQMIGTSTKRLDETIHNLNEIISIQSNTNLPLIQVNVRNEIERVIESVSVLVSNAGTEVIFHFDNDQHLVTNPAYFESIILNLITNALRYKSPERPLKIDLRFSKRGDYKVLSFQDNGIGIDLKKNGDMLFGMYNTFNGNKDAKGLGLFIIKTQVEAMKGKIEVESELGSGTTFHIFYSDSLLKQEV